MNRTTTITLTLSLDEALVLNDFLHDLTEKLRKSRVGSRPIAEEVVFRKMLKDFEKNVPELLQSDYAELLERARRRVVEG